MTKLLHNIYLQTFGIPGHLSRNMAGGRNVLDLGCGKNSPLQYVHKNLRKVGVDYYSPYLDEAKRKNIHNTYIQEDLTKLTIDDKSFDYVIFIEVIEHFKKEEGYKIIKDMERIAREKVIITTPNGFLPTSPSSTDNPDEKHVSGWSVDEFKELGYKVRGFNGLKFLWKINDNGLPQYVGPRWMILPIKILSEPLCYFFPKLSFQIIAIKSF